MSRRHEPEPVVTDVDDTAAQQHQQVTAAAAIAAAARLTVQAHQAGMPIESARRWPLYLAMKRRKGEFVHTGKQVVFRVTLGLES